MSFIICPNCGFKNEEGSEFCAGCGIKLNEQGRDEEEPEVMEELDIEEASEEKEEEDYFGEDYNYKVNYSIGRITTPKKINQDKDEEKDLIVSTIGDHLSKPYERIGEPRVTEKTPGKGKKKDTSKTNKKVTEVKKNIVNTYEKSNKSKIGYCCCCCCVLLMLIAAFGFFFIYMRY